MDGLYCIVLEGWPRDVELLLVVVILLLLLLVVVVILLLLLLVVVVILLLLLLVVVVIILLLLLLMCRGRDGWMAPGCGTCSAESAPAVKQPAAEQPDLLTKNSPHVWRNTSGNLEKYNLKFGQIQFTIQSSSQIWFKAKTHHMLPASL